MKVQRQLIACVLASLARIRSGRGDFIRAGDASRVGDRPRREAFIYESVVDVTPTLRR